MIKAALFGVGRWAHSGWLQTLLDASEAELLRLTVVDLSPDPPPVLAEDSRSHLATYKQWDRRNELHDLDLAVIAVPAKEHLHCLQELIPLMRAKGHVVCEKPGGDSLLEFVTMWDECRRRDIDFAISDHYLVRPDLQTALASFGKEPPPAHSLQSICAFMREQMKTGPAQVVEFDMAVHMINILHVLLPGSFYRPQKSHLGAATKDSHVPTTYAFTQGYLLVDDAEVPCQIEVGKQMPQDRKEILLDMGGEMMVIGLRKAPDWRYDRIVAAVAANKRLAAGSGQSGAVAPHIALRTWISMASIQRQAERINPYEPGTLPKLGPFKRRSEGNQEAIVSS